MTVRITSERVVFTRPFVLSGFEQVEPAGTYLVDTEEESFDELSFLVWKRLATVIHITHGASVEYVRIDPEDLRKALVRDAAQAETGPSAQERLDSARRRNDLRLTILRW